jgi:anaerobic magnesium-protoporphyrin IX monomethyl ester cyclase
MKIMISYPALEGKGSPMLTQNRQFQWMSIGSYIYPLVPAYAATLLKEDGHEVIWYDGIAEHLPYEHFLKTVENEKPDIVVFETKTPVVKLHWAIIRDVKKIRPETRTILMGDHVTALPEESFMKSEVDFVITGGDYDFTLRELANTLSGNRVIPSGVFFRNGSIIKNTGPFSLKGDLDTLPFIDRDLTKAHLYYEKWKKREPFRYTMAGRDCQWGKCTFCSWTITYPNFRTRSVKNLLDEIEMLVGRYHVKEVFDDTGNFPAGGWLKKFCEGMIERGLNKEILFSCNMRFDYLVRSPELLDLMKKAGFRKVKSGLESASQETLNRIRKNIKVEDIIEGCRLTSKAGIDVHLTIMVGYPWETREDALRTLHLAKDLMTKGYAEMLQSTIVIPYPGTPLYEEARRNGWIRFEDPEAWERYDMTEPVLVTPDMGPEEVMRICSDIYKNFITPRYIIRHLLKIRSFEDLSYMMRGSRAVIGHILDFAKIRL